MIELTKIFLNPFNLHDPSLTGATATEMVFNKVPTYDELKAENEEICDCEECLKWRTKGELKPEVKKDVFIRTFTGGVFHPLEPKEDEVNIFDIAHALSQMCRFNGHTREFYSVAQHSVLVAEQYIKEGYTPKEAIGALLHDADEAYMMDLATPIKYGAKFGKEFKEISARINRKIMRWAGARDRYDEYATKIIDKRMLATEQSQLMVNAEYDVSYQLFDIKIEPWSMTKAEDEFLKAFIKYRDMKYNG